MHVVHVLEATNIQFVVIAIIWQNDKEDITILLHIVSNVSMNQQPFLMKLMGLCGKEKTIMVKRRWRECLIESNPGTCVL